MSKIAKACGTRITWDVNPVTKVVKSKKVYSRKNKHKNSRYE